MTDGDWEHRYQTFKEFIGSQIAELRKEKGKSLRALAEECRVSHEAIWKVEKAKTDPRLSTLFLISEALEEPVALLLCAQTDPKRPDEFYHTFGGNIVAELQRIDEVIEASIRDWLVDALTDEDAVQRLASRVSGHVISSLIEIPTNASATTTEPTGGNDHGA